MIKYERLDDTKEVLDWAKQHEAIPAERELPDGETELTFNLDGQRDGEPLDWDKFLQRFRLEGLALLVEPEVSSSHYFKFVVDSNQKDAIKTGLSSGQDLNKHVQTSDFRAH